MIQINPLLSIVNQLLQRETLKIADYAQAIRDARQMLNEAFQAGENVLLLLQQHADFIDAVLQHLWNASRISSQRATLVAVGGYGRRELHPASDVDLMVLLTENPQAECNERLSAFITLLGILGWMSGIACAL